MRSAIRFRSSVGAQHADDEPVLPKRLLVVILDLDLLVGEAGPLRQANECAGDAAASGARIDGIGRGRAGQRSDLGCEEATLGELARRL